MDDLRFDAALRALNAGTTRRRGLAAAAGLLLGGFVVDAGAADRKRPEREGPCGDRSGKDNRCTKDKECCTGVCNRKIGRCRCLQRGAACTSDENCCGTTRCKKGICGTPKDACTVCASGCQYGTIQAAVDAAKTGAVISIGVKSGGYAENVSVTKSLTLQGCKGTPTINPASGIGVEIPFTDGESRQVTLRGLRLQGSGVAGTGVKANMGFTSTGGAFDITLDGLTVDGWGDPAGSDSYSGGVILNVAGSVTVTGGTFTANTQHLSLADYTTRALTVAITGATLSGGGGAGPANQCALGIYGDLTTAVVTDTAITGYSGRAGGLSMQASTVTLAGATVISSNVASLGGGGVSASWGGGGQSMPTKLTIEQTVRITGNQAPVGSGIAAQEYVSGGITGANDTTVAPNGNGDQCQLTFNSASPQTVNNCAFA
jgi:hypothetical protein